MTNNNFLVKSIKRNKVLYLLLLLPIINIIIFRYIPMFGILVAFKNYKITKGFFHSDWVGFKYFVTFFNSISFWPLLRNTLLISLYSLIFNFPAPIILALSLNEVRSRTFKRFTQTVSYLPHFISTVVVVGIVIQFLSPSAGFVNTVIKVFGFKPVFFIMEPEWFRTILITSDIWASVGWGSILYLAALSAIDVQLYEAATIDGAGRWKKMLHITLPGIAPTIIVLLLLRIGHILDTGYEKILLLYQPTTYSVADVIDTYVYRIGISKGNAFGYATAIGVFKSVFGLILLTFINRFSKKITDTSLW